MHRPDPRRPDPLSRRDVLRNAAAAAAFGGIAPIVAACSAGGRTGPRRAAILPETLVPLSPNLAIPTSALTVRRADERGRANLGWLDTRHTFSFADYYDPDHMGFRRLRVINDDVVKAGQGFPMHPHRDMEIVTYVLDGALEHKDTLGNGSVIRPGEVQRMSAGRGIRHSEYNPLKDADVRLLQIWIEPTSYGTDPGYEQKTFTQADRGNRLRLVASPDGREGSVVIRTDARLYAGILDAGRTVEHGVIHDRHAWLQIARGSVTVNGVALFEGDGLSASTPGALELVAGPGGAEVLAFDLA